MIPRIIRIIPKSTIGKRKFHSTSYNLSDISQKNPRTKYYDFQSDLRGSYFKKIKAAIFIFKEEFKMFIQEIKRNITMDYDIIFRRGEVDVVWRFKDDPNSTKRWVVTTDADNNNGFSTAKLDLSPQGTAIFSGVLSTRIPKDGVLKYTGYCNMKTTPIKKSFLRENKLDWGQYTHIVLRVRGDGRCYAVNIGQKGEIDLSWDDVYTYVLYTRGGPYWQYIKLPFSKFCFHSRGKVQDRQNIFTKRDITSFGITLSDNVSGPFRLEIDYIGLEFDPFAEEVTAYESYRTDDVIF